MHTVRSTMRASKQGGAADKPPEPEIRSSQVIVFDESGNQVEEAHHGSDGSLVGHTTSTYDAAGRLLERSIYSALGGSSQTTRLVQVYDPDGRLIERRSYAPDGSLAGARRCTYDRRGRRIEELDLDLPVGIEPPALIALHLHGDDHDPEYDLCLPRGGGRLRKVYDVRGNLVEVSAYGRRGQRFGRHVFVYDAEGRLARSEQRGGGRFSVDVHTTRWRRLLGPVVRRLGMLLLRLYGTFRLGAQGELRQAAGCLIRGSRLDETAYLYDAEGRKVEERRLFAGMLLARTAFKYDEWGNLVEEVQSIGDGLVVSRESLSREYDDHGNWTREVKTRKLPAGPLGQPWETVEVTNRELTYYPDSGPPAPGR